MLFKSRKVFKLTTGLVIIGCVVYFLFLPRRGDVIETWQTGNGSFSIRVTAYTEKNTFPALGGGYYVFESTAAGSDRWDEIMVFRHDDPINILRDQVRFVSNQVGYVFMGWMYAVTTDAGATWLVWSAEKDMPEWECCNYGLIQDIRLAPDGTGEMKLRGRRGEVHELHTKDYGGHWSAA